MSEHRCARSCPVHPRGLEEREKDTSEHRCARSCPVRPCGLEERERRTRASTNVLAHVVGVLAVSKEEDSE